MLRRVALAAATVATATVAAGVAPESASAYYGQNPITVTGNWPQVNALLRQVSPPTALAGGTVSPPQTSAARQAWFRASRAIGSPIRMSAGTLTLGATALYVGYKIPGILGIDRWAFGVISGSPPAQTAPAAGTYRAYSIALGCASGGMVTLGVETDIGALLSTVGGCAWVPNVKYSSDSGATYPTTFNDGAVRYTGAGCATRDGASQDAIYSALEAVRTSSAYTFTWSACVYMSSYYRRTLYALPDTVSDNFTPTELRDYVGASDSSRIMLTASGAAASPVESGSDQADAALAALEASPELETYLGKLIDPTWEGTTDPGSEAFPIGTLVLPQPELDETALEYRARLRNLGWLGTFSTTDWAGSLPTLTGSREWKDGDPVRIRTGTGTTVDYDLADPWPGDPSGSEADEPSPRLDLDAPVEWQKVPTGSGTRTGTTPGPAGVGEGGGSACEPWLETTFNLDPLLDLELGETFPFGVPLWILDQVDALVATPDAPSWAINVPSVGADYEIDLEPFDPYMATMRLVVTWLLWLGTIWYVGTSVLGFRGTGNPADAVDDYLEGMIP